MVGWLKCAQTSAFEWDWLSACGLFLDNCGQSFQVVVLPCLPLIFSDKVLLFVAWLLLTCGIHCDDAAESWTFVNKIFFYSKCNTQTFLKQILLVSRYLMVTCRARSELYSETWSKWSKNLKIIKSSWLKNRRECQRHLCRIRFNTNLLLIYDLIDQLVLTLNTQNRHCALVLLKTKVMWGKHWSCLTLMLVSKQFPLSYDHSCDHFRVIDRSVGIPPPNFGPYPLWCVGADTDGLFSIKVY